DIPRAVAAALGCAARVNRSGLDTVHQHPIWLWHVEENMRRAATRARDQFINSPDRQLDFSLRRGDPSVRRTATRPRGRLPGERDCVVVRRADAGGEVQLHLFAILTALTRAT